MSKLATFRIEEDIWEGFLATTKEEGASASSVLVEFVKWYMEGNRTTKPAAVTSEIEGMIDARILTALETQLEARVVALLDSRLGELAA